MQTQSRPDTDLVGQHEDEDRGVLDGEGEIALRDQVLGKLDAGQVLDVLVLPVDDLGQARLHAVVRNLLGEDPLANLVLETLLPAIAAAV